MSAERPVVAVVGAGSVGCYVGGWLGRGADVRLVGRARVRDLLAEHGLDLTDLEGGHLHLAPEALEFATTMDVVAEAALVLVTVKSDDTPAVARQLAPLLRADAVVVSFQNGVRNVPVLREALPGHTVLAGMVPFNILHRGLGHLHRASGGSLMAESDPALAPFVPLFESAGLPLELRGDMPAVQWAKLLLNLNNAVNALSDLTLHDELALRPYRRCLAMAQREALRVMARAGIRPARLTAVPTRWLPALLEAPDPVFRVLARRLLAIDPLARSSTWEDLAAGRHTEIAHINGEVVALARRHGMQAPVNARLVALVQAAEAGDRRVWHRHELLDALRAAAG